MVSLKRKHILFLTAKPSQTRQYALHTHSQTAIYSATLPEIKAHSMACILPFEAQVTNSCRVEWWVIMCMVMCSTSVTETFLQRNLQQFHYRYAYGRVITRLRGLVYLKYAAQKSAWFIGTNILWHLCFYTVLGLMNMYSWTFERLHAPPKNVEPVYEMRSSVAYTVEHYTSSTG